MTIRNSTVALLNEWISSERLIYIQGINVSVHVCMPATKQVGAPNENIVQNHLGPGI